jgi:hypothetical protein
MKVLTRACIAVLLGITLGAVSIRQTHAQGTFTGSWSTSTANPGWFYDLTMSQTGAKVTGSYTVTTADEQQGTKRPRTLDKCASKGWPAGIVQQTPRRSHLPPPGVLIGAGVPQGRTSPASSRPRR